MRSRASPSPCPALRSTRYGADSIAVLRHRVLPAVVVVCCFAFSGCATPDAAQAGFVPLPRSGKVVTGTTQCEGVMDLPSPQAGSTDAEPPSLAALREAAPYRQLDTSGDAARLAMVRQSAISLGMRAGFNRAIWCRQQEVMRRAVELDRIYDFRALLFDAGAGFMFEPGVVTEEFDARKVDRSGMRAAAAASRIVMSATEAGGIVTRARDWRQYLIVETEPLAPQAPEARPLPDDATLWRGWVAEGWKRGLRQATDTMDALWNRLDRDYVGMVSYRRMMLEGKVAPPRSVVTDRGVTGNIGEVRVGDVQVETRRPGQLEANPARWRPLPFITPPAARDRKEGAP